MKQVLVTARRRVELLDVELPSAPLGDDELAGPTLATAVSAGTVECSGHEQAVLDGCKVVRKRGEVALVGVPWRACSDMLGHALLHAVFHRYAVVRSGWEWELARRPADFRTGSIFANYAAALAWLAEGRVSVAGLYRKVAPADCQQVYDDLFGGRFPALAAVFDWTAP